MISLAFKRQLIQDELADLTLYQTLHARAQGQFKTTLEHFIETEKRHVAFWQQTFSLTEDKLSLPGRLRNIWISLVVRMFGEGAGYILLEAVETHGIKKYLELWNQTQDPSVRQGLKQILTEELLHEDEAATGGNRTVDPDTVRNTFLGFNDGSVEILGAVSGLTAALQNPNLVAVSALTISVAGAISMAAGAFMSTHSEAEVRNLAAAKQAFLKLGESDTSHPAKPWKAARIVGIAYLVGAAVPVAPFLFGAQTPMWSILLSGILILTVSALIAFLSGMALRRRVLMNIGIIIVAVGISYGFGILLETV